MRLSASKLPLLQVCGYFVREGVAWSHSVGRSAELGTATHSIAEAAIEAKCGRRTVDLDALIVELTKRHSLTPDEAAQVRALGVQVIDFVLANANPSWLTEQPFALELATGKARQLEKTKHREYAGKADGELGVTLDVCGMLSPTRALVLDFKTGFCGGKVDASDHWQLLAQGAAVVDAWQVDDVLIVIAHVTPEGVKLSEALVDGFAVEAYLDRVRSALAAAETAEPTPGAHCKELYCPAIAACPKVEQAMELALPPSTSIEAFRFAPIESEAHAAWMVGALDLVKLGVKAADAALKAYADEHGGIPLANGKTWRKHSYAVEGIDLDNPKAFPIIAEAGATDAIKRSLPWGAVEKAIGKEGAATLRKDLRCAGALTETTRSEYEARK